MSMRDTVAPALAWSASARRPRYFTLPDTCCTWQPSRTRRNREEEEDIVLQQRRAACMHACIKSTQLDGRKFFLIFDFRLYEDVGNFIPFVMETSGRINNLGCNFVYELVRARTRVASHGHTNLHVCYSVIAIVWPYCLVWHHTSRNLLLPTLSIVTEVPC